MRVMFRLLYVCLLFSQFGSVRFIWSSTKKLWTCTMICLFVCS
jgi:hypothetical protein